MLFATLLFFSLVNLVTAEFWLTTTIEELSFDQKCISFSRCDIPDASFQLTHSIPSIHESKSNTFPVVHLVEKVSYVSFWDYGNPESVLTELSIVKNMGVKPNMLWYCDETGQKVFITELIEKKDHYAQYMLKGRCFNATISLQKHLGHVCPWCVEATPEVAKYTFSQTMAEVLNKIQSDNYILYPVLVAVGLAIVLLLVLCCFAVRAVAAAGRQYTVRKHHGRTSRTDSEIPIYHHHDNTNTTSSPTLTDRSSPAYVNSRIYGKRAAHSPRCPLNLPANTSPYDPVACMQRYAAYDIGVSRPIIRNIRMPDTPVSRISTPSMSSAEDV